MGYVLCYEGVPFEWHVKPEDLPNNGLKPADGMSLRDYFAGQAIIALMSSPIWMKGADAAFSATSLEFKRGLAGHAYIMADEMLRARRS
jgi:hypothetical protein